MSGFRDVIKGFFSTLFGIGRDPDEEFIFFWDDEEDTKIKSEEFSFIETFRTNRTEITIALALILIIVSLIFNDTDNLWVTIVPLYISLFLLALSFYYLQIRYKDPMEMVNSTMNRLKDMDLTDTGEFLYVRNAHESLQNLEVFRSNMSEITSKLDDTAIELMNSLFLVEEKFRSVEFVIDNVSSLIDTSGMSTANYQEIKFYTNRISTGVDSFTSVFDESLNSTADVVSVVKSIGKQINMLALNAGIEAARAGEMGIGFEVVSDNLRRLSQHAVTTTSDMKTIRSSINTDARTALETITESMNVLVNNIDNTYISVSSVNNDLYQVKQNLVSIAEDMANVQHLINIIGTELQRIKN
ncbi:MAG: hypothetical protein GPJ54_14930 [Candidatus Heimdallarchaeota archaeon]|nr:hypothetical protein [Candidatus Heimdallarchaeota archaeon]